MLQFWRNVKDELEYNLITQKELASKLDISYNTLQSWITKDRLPDAEQAVKIAQTLNTSVEYLVTGIHSNQKDIKPDIQFLIPKMNHLSDENIKLLSAIIEKIK